MSIPTQPVYLEPSPLGTREYWDELYVREISNHAEDSSQIGTVWFEDSGAEEKVLGLLERDDLELSQESTSFIDLGTGNGSMLFALQDEGWQGPMVGVDYSSVSVDLARQIQSQRGSDGEEVVFAEWDLLKQEPGTWKPTGGVDVVLDKGTFDAISLNAEVDERGKRVMTTYRAKVEPLIKPAGLLVITSCNWTKDELIHWLEGETLTFFTEAKYPTYKFGGAEGSTIVTLCFKKKAA